MTEKCFKKCINKPGTSLDTSEQVSQTVTQHETFLTRLINDSNFIKKCHEFKTIYWFFMYFITYHFDVCVKNIVFFLTYFCFQKCVAMCMDRYMDSWNLVSKAYSLRLQKERNRM